MSTWVLLRGLMREARHWGDFPQQLGQALGSKQLVTPNFAGNGQLSHLLSASNVPQMVQQIRRDVLAAGYPPPYHIVALSLGAMAATAWAQTFPQELAGTVLINTSLRPFSRFYQRLRPANYPRLLATLLRAKPLQFENTILDLSSNMLSREQRAQVLNDWRHFAQQNPVSKRNILRQLTAAMRFRAASHAPQVPLLLLAGETDRLVNVQCSKSVAQAWHCPIATHPQAGHDLPLDDAAWVVQQIVQWLATIPAHRAIP